MFHLRDQNPVSAQALPNARSSKVDFLVTSMLVLGGAALICLPSPASGRQTHLPCGVSDPEGGADFQVAELPNGLRYIIDRAAGEPVAMSLIVNAGTADETSSQRAAAHVLEHAAIQYYEGRRGAYADAVRSGDIDIDTHLANTSFLNTKYMVTVSPVAHDIDKLVLAAVDWLTIGDLNQVNFDIAKDSVLRESTSITPDSREAKKIGELIFGSSRFELGAEEEKAYSLLDMDAMRSFHAKWYRTDLATFVVTGDIDVRKWKAAICRVFGALPRPKSPFPRAGGIRVPKPELSGQLGTNRIFQIESTDRSSLRVRLFFKRPMRLYSLSNYRGVLVRQLAVAALGRGVSLGNQSFETIDGANFADDLESVGAIQGLLVLKFDDGPGVNGASNIKQHVERLVVRLRQLQKFGVSEPALEAGRKVVAKAISDTVYKGPPRMADYWEGLDWGPIVKVPSQQEKIDILRKITKKEVDEYIRTVMDPTRGFDTVIQGSSEIIDDGEARSAVLAGIEAGKNRAAAPPVVSATVKQLLPTPPVWNGSAKVMRLGKAGAIVQLSNGITVFLNRQTTPKDIAPPAMALVRAGSNDAFLRRHGLQSLGATISARPLDISKAIFDDYAELLGIRTRVSVNIDRTAVSVLTSSDDLRHLFSAADVVLSAVRGGGELLSRDQYGLNEGDGPIDRWTLKPRQQASIVEESLKGFAPNWVILSGAFDLEQAIDLAKRHFGRWATLAVSEPVQYRPTLSARQEREATTGAGKAECPLLYSAELPQHEELTALLLAELANEKIFIKSRELGGYRTGGLLRYYPSSIGRLIGVADYCVVIDTVDAKMSLQKRALRATLESIRRGEFNPVDFERAKRVLLEARSRYSKRPDRLNEIATQRLTVTENPEAILEDESTTINSISLDDAKRVASKLFSEATFAEIVPAK